jgi:glycosyltransferase involved in cell wall biosynthesis
MKICMITPWQVKCGVASYSKDLSKALANRGHEIYITRLPRFGEKTPDILKRVIDNVVLDCDLVHVQHEYGLYQAYNVEFFSSLREVGLPIVTTFHAVGNFEVDGPIQDISAKSIVHNKFCFNNLPMKEKAVIIPHGCNAPITCPPVEECKSSLGIPDPRIPVIGYCGYISAYKGLETLIDAVCGIENVGLLIAGGTHTGPDSEYMFALKRRTLEVLPNRCRWMGYVEPQDLPKMYGSMDVVVYPSRFVSESGALLMALTYQKAVIASELPPIVEKEDRGALKTFKDVEDLRNVLLDVLNPNTDLKRKLEVGAKYYALQVAWPKIAELHEDLYRDVIGKKAC